MHIISKKPLQEFWKIHADAETPLTHWFKIVSKTDFKNFNALRKTFSSADVVGKCVIFNIGGNKYRLITVIHFNRRTVYIRDVLTHDEYNRRKWNECTNQHH